MKKSLLLMAGLVLASAASAGEPVVVPGCLTGTSYDGKWAAGSNPFDYSFSIYNVETGDFQWFDPEEICVSEGFGHFISNDGIVVGSGMFDEMPYIFENGEWKMLPVDMDKYYMVAANCISADGNLIAGYASPSAFGMSGDDENSIIKPVVWTRGEDGEFGELQVLPYPTRDLVNRAPQSILISSMNEDGSVLVGQVVDGGGWMRLPILYRIDDEGNWQYEFHHPELSNPYEVELVEYPGEAPEEPDGVSYLEGAALDAYLAALEEFEARPYPNQKDFMSEEELAAWQAAYDAYMEDYYNNPYPYIEDYMTEEEKLAYQNYMIEYYDTPRPDPADYMTEEQRIEYEMALAAYEENFSTWQDAYWEFDDAYSMLLATAPEYQQNSGRVSANGQYAIHTIQIAQEDENAWFGYSYIKMPFLFSVDGDDYYELSEGVSDFFGTYVTNNGAVIGCSPADDYYSRGIYLSPSAGAPIQSINEYLAEKNPALNSWIEENMTHEVMVEQYNPETEEMEISVVEMPLTGTACADPELSTIVTWVVNTWSYDDEEAEEPAAPVYSYILPLNDASGIGNVAASKGSSVAVSMDRSGVITISGDAKNVVVYDVNGRVVFRSNAPAATINTGLKQGAYIVKAEGADGKTAVKKAII